MKQNGCLIISLDFELLWGVFDVFDATSNPSYFHNTQKVIPQVLKMFVTEEIHCTWATVGMLFNKDWKEWDTNIPDRIPHYQNKKLSAYTFGEETVRGDTDPYFAPGLIQDIINSKGQELGTHTYSHYYCQEEGQTLEDFEADLGKAVSMAKQFGVEIRSLVFPRNQFKKEYLEICSANGIESVRTNPDDWYWKNPSSEALKTKLFRTGDAYNLLGKRKSYPFSDLVKRDGLPLEQKASRFLRPHGKNRLLNTLRLKRIKKEMTAAARNKEIYHLWWHPHNFGDHPEESLKELKEIIYHFKILQSRYRFASVNMGELTVNFLKKS